MKRPNGDLNQLVRTLDSGARFTINDVREEQVPVRTQLADEDEAYLSRLLKRIRGGSPAVIIVEEKKPNGDTQLKYMFSGAYHHEAIAMLGKVIESTARRIGGEEPA